MPNSVTLEGKDIQAITQQEKEAIKNLLADHLLDFYYYYIELSELNYESKLNTLLSSSRTLESFFSIGIGGGAMIGFMLGALAGGLPGAISGGVLGFYLGTVLSMIGFLLCTGVAFIYDLIAEDSFNKQKNIGERLHQISPQQAPTKMKEIANDLIEKQLMKENIKLNQINLYQIASHAIAGLKTPNHNEDVQTAMLRGAQEKRDLFSFPKNIWFWIKSLFIKSDQAFQLKKYSDAELNKPILPNNHASSNTLINLEVPQPNNSHEGLGFFSPENKETRVDDNPTSTPSPSHSS